MAQAPPGVQEAQVPLQGAKEAQGAELNFQAGVSLGVEGQQGVQVGLQAYLALQWP